MISEIRQSTVSVSKLASALSFYENAFDYVVHAEGSVSGPAFKALWGLPEPVSGKIAIIGPEGATSGLLRLVQFDRPGEQYWGDYSGMNNYGHYALNIRVADIQATFAAILDNGGRSRTEPTYWTVSPTLSAWDTMSYDPDGTLLDVFQLDTKPGSALHDYDGRTTPLQTVALHSSDACRSACFYAALGFRPMYNKRLENMESVFHIPQGTTLHNINMMMPSEPGIGRFEIAQYVGWPGVSQRDRAVPPALGILNASLQTDDLSATEALLESIGAEPAGKRVEVQMPGLGNIAARSYYGPDDELLELYQTL